MAIAALGRAVSRKRGSKKKSKAKAKPTRAGKRAKRGAAKRKQNKLARSVKRAPVRWKIPRNKRESIEAIFRDQFGAAPRGTSWSLLAERYPERFRDYLDAGLEQEE